MHVQTIRTLLKLEPCIAAEQRDGLHRPGSRRLPERMNDDLFLDWPLESDRVEYVALRGEAEVFGRVGSGIRIVK